VTLVVLAVWPANGQAGRPWQHPDVNHDLVTSQTLTELWELRWAKCPPFAHWLGSHYPDRWVRFHSLPGSKRYASNDTEYETILDRHYTVISELGPGSEIVVITSEWTPTPELTLQQWPRRSEIAPRARHWRTLLEEPDVDPEYRSYTQLYAEAVPWRPSGIDALLRAVADDELANVIVAPTDLRWLYHPYDGGADVIAESQAERDALKARHADWLSGHPSGM
jgi:hypothetical protein